MPTHEPFDRWMLLTTDRKTGERQWARLLMESYREARDEANAMERWGVYTATPVQIRITPVEDEQ